MAARSLNTLNEALGLRVIAYMPIPESWSAKTKAAAIAGDIMPITRPDFENIAKLIGRHEPPPASLQGRSRKAADCLVRRLSDHIGAATSGRGCDSRSIGGSAAVERLTIDVAARVWIHRPHRIVAVYAPLRGDSAMQPIAIVMRVPLQGPPSSTW